MVEALRPSGRRAWLPAVSGLGFIVVAILLAVHPPHIGTANLVFEGIVNGFNVSLLGMGIVLVYRSSRVINFAIGAMGLPAAVVLGTMVGKSHWPYIPALLFALFVGTASGTAVEVFIIRRLFKAPRVIVLVATIGIAELAEAVVLWIPDFRTGKLSNSFPTPITSETTFKRIGWHTNLGLFKLHSYVTNVHLDGAEMLTLLIIPIVTIFLWYLLGHTAFGESVRAAATNADLARLTGVSPKMMSTAVWTISGFLSAAAVILYATNSPSPALVSIGNDTLLLGLTAALIGGMESFPRTVMGAVGISILYQVLIFNFTETTGLISFVLFLLVLFLVARRSRDTESGGESFSFAPRIPAVPERLKEIWWVRRLPQLIGLVALAFAIILPFAISQPSHHQTYTTILATAIAAMSVTVLTGWAGQLSLGQAAFAGLGGFAAASITAGVHVNMGWKSHRIVQGSLRPVPMLLMATAVLVGLILVATGLARPRGRLLWIGLGIVAFVGAGISSIDVLDRSTTADPITTLPVSVPHPFPMVGSLFVGAAISCLVAVAIGLGALRVKGLLLAISTMAFAIAAQEYILPRPILIGSTIAQNVSLSRGKFFFINLAEHYRTYYWFTLAVLVVILVLLSHLRRTGVGRMIVGVRENEPGAAALTVSAARAKLTAFAIAGFVAGLSGGLLVGALGTVGYQASDFQVERSFQLVAMAVIGGLGSLAGAVTGALWVGGLPAFWPDNDVVPLLTSSIGLLIILLYFPGGFMQLAYWTRGLLFGWVEKRLPEQPAKTMTAPPATLARVSTAPLTLTLNADDSVLATRALTVRFGGLTAVDGVDFRAEAGEVIGLIGTNGAGKSTLLNAIGGYVASDGRVELLGRDVSKLAPHRRAACGLGRTFQAATLFPELTVRETVQLALEARERTPFWGSLFYWSYGRERRKRSEAAELIDFLGLGRYADRFVAELSTGTRRIVELTTVLAVAPRVICLDEPTAGVAQREAEAFGPLIKRVQHELDATLIVVEHDLPLILSISDRVYCLEAGAVIAEGTPSDVRNDPRVVASYLGTDERAIQRSNATA